MTVTANGEEEPLYYGTCSLCESPLEEEDEDLCSQCWEEGELRGNRNSHQPLRFDE